ncbi:hypothetical protein BT69DRAFT_1212462 [Atractiella rhizophila]|nr:hypothetical protein BT69DRAFT_1212462 [Atractiella rhizophila]
MPRLAHNTTSRVRTAPYTLPSHGDSYTPPPTKTSQRQLHSRLGSSSKRPIDLCDLPTIHYSASAPDLSSLGGFGGFGSAVEKPAPKRGRKSVGATSSAPAGKEGTEKRLARVKKACPKVILDRVERVYSQRFFMVDRHRNGDDLKEEFKVLGSTGNVYTVTITHVPTCTCPDAQKGNHCKHILFVFLKVLGVKASSNLYYQKALLTSELVDIFANAKPNPTALANSTIMDAYTAAKAGASTSTGVQKRLPGAGEGEEDCPICYEEMKSNDSTLVFCETGCGKPLHKECFGQWSTCGGKPTCPSCRATWGPAPKAGTVNHEGYLNFGGVGGIARERDTSTYYHGVMRRGYERGYERRTELDPNFGRHDSDRYC